MVDKLRLEVLLGAVDRITAPLKRINSATNTAAQGLKDARDKLKQLNDAQKALNEFRSVRQGLRATQAQLQAAQDRTAALAQQLRQTETPTRALTRQFNAARREAAQLGERFQEQSQRAQQLRDRLGAAGISTRNLVEQQRGLRSQIGTVTAGIDRQTEALKRQTEQQRKLSALKDQHAKHMMHAGMVGGAGYAGMAAGRNAGTRMGQFMGEGVRFNSQMSRVQALARLDKNSPELAELRAQAQQLGADTMFSATQAAQGQAFLAMAGFQPKAIMGAMPGLLDMSKAGDMELGRGADIASNILSAFDIDPSRMGWVADVLTKTFTSSNVNLEMLGNTMSYAGPVARAANVDLETVSAMAGLLGNVGIQGEKAGTALRAMLLRLAAPTSKAAKTIKALGVETADSAGNIRPVVDLLGEIAAKTEKMGSAERMEILKEIFGEEPAAAMSELINKAGSDGIRKYLTEVRDNAGAAARTAKVMADNLEGDLDELSSGWADVRIAVNDVNDAWMRAATQGLTDVVRGVGDWVKQHPALVKGLSMVAVGGAAVLTVVGGLTIALALVVGKMLLVRFLLAQLGVRFAVASAAARAAGGIVRGFGAAIGWIARTAVPMLVAGFARVATAAVWVGRALMFTPVGRIVALVMLLGSAALWVWRNWSTVSAFFAQLWAGLLAGVSNVWQSFTQLGGMLIDGLIGGISSRLGALRETIVGAASSAVQWFKERLGIHSPSRVFMELGSDVGEGAALGIRNGAAMVRAAALGLSVAAAAPMVAATEANPQPSAAPLAAMAPRAAASAAQPAAGSSYTISIHAAPGMDPQAIARAVAAELDRRERANASRRYSRLADID